MHDARSAPQFLLPGGLLAIAALGTLALVFPGVAPRRRRRKAQSVTPRSRRAAPSTSRASATVAQHREPLRQHQARLLRRRCSSATATAPSPTPTRPRPTSPRASSCSTRPARAATGPRPTASHPTGAGHDRPQPAGRRCGHRRLLDHHRPHAGHRRRGRRGRAQAAPAHRQAGAARWRRTSTRSTPRCLRCPLRT